MENHYIKFINCGQIQVAASCETRSNAITDAYYASTVLMFTQIGQMHVFVGEKEYVVPRGSFAIIRKYTEARLQKTWTKAEGQAKVYGFVLANEFIHRVIEKIPLEKNGTVPSDPFISVPTTQRLKELIKPIITYMDEGADLDVNLVESKTLEALKALAEADSNLLSSFINFSLFEKADLEKLMTHNFLYNIPLKELANQSGRSLSTFNRDFKLIFHETPHRWIMKKRLYHARDLMKKEKRRPSEVYLESGFEDLSHFSRSFKKQFRITPSQFYKNVC